MGPFTDGQLLGLAQHFREEMEHEYDKRRPKHSQAKCGQRDCNGKSHITTLHLLSGATTIFSIMGTKESGRLSFSAIWKPQAPSTIILMPIVASRQQHIYTLQWIQGDRLGGWYEILIPSRPRYLDYKSPILEKSKTIFDRVKYLP